MRLIVTDYCQKPQTNTMKTKAFITAAILASALHASAASVIYTPISVSQTGGGAPNSGALVNTINGSGLSSPLADGAQIPALLPTHQGGLTYGSNAVRWLFTANYPTTLTFDLGSLETIDSLIFYNYNELFSGDYYNNRGITSVTAEFSTDNISYSDATTLSFSLADENNPFSGELVGFSEQTAQYVRFSNIAGGDGAIIGFSEIRFTAVPEPSSTALLGLGLCSMLLRRKRS